MRDVNVSTLVARSRWKLTCVFMFHTVTLSCCCISLAMINVMYSSEIGDKVILANASLFGLIGTIIYFSRKTYVYMMTNKFGKIASTSEFNDFESVKTSFRGYYLYLIFRPVVGIVIGPIMYMMFMSGVVTFMKSSIKPSEIATSGRFLVYIVSFLGGHACSDLFDRFSRLAREVILKRPESRD